MTNASVMSKRIETELKRSASPERAVAEKKYLKSDLSFLGATLGDIRRVTKQTVKSAETQDAALKREGVLALVEELWQKPLFERRMAAVIVLEQHTDELRSADLRLIERLIRESYTWAFVDALAANVVGGLAVRYKIRRVLDRWARDEDFWIRRSSLLAELRPLKNGAPFEPFALRAEAMLEEKQFFIRKAIGWVLRETSKSRPDEVFNWIAPRTDRASGVTMRETVRYLGQVRSALLMDAYREHRPAK
ncbi:MAG: DNA alkylation repair protein [Actinomycetes bacterium]